MKNSNKISKTSTLYKKDRENNTEAFRTQRDEFIQNIVNSKPRMNIRVIISDKLL